MKNLPVCFVLLLFAASPVFSQATIHVPADYPTIQAGINAANNGDIVLVGEGIYYENINFLGKAITVASHFYLDQREKHIRKTIINGSQPADPDFGSVVSFASGEDINSVLCGFTITGGTGTLELFPGFPPGRAGGGILCSFSGATIIHNIIKGNKAENGFIVMGGGFASTPPWTPAYVILENNIFEENFVSGSFITGGGGASVASSGRVVKNSFINNTSYALEGSADGGGISVQSWDPSVSPPNEVYMSGNIIVHNKALQNETATYWLGGTGGGMTILGSKGEFTNNVIQHNEVNAVNSSFAPGVLFDFPPDEVYFRNNIVSHNTFSGAGACFGGGFAVWDGNPTLENNLFEKNKATYGGGGWIGDAFSFAKIINNTIIKNHAEMKGGALYAKSAAPTVMNSILWNNKAPEGAEIFVESGTIDVSYSTVDGGWPGTGNMGVNPGLIGVMQLLGPSSLCIDAGNPDPLYNDPEDIHFPGYAQLPARGTIRNDMGAYGGAFATDWGNLFNFKEGMLAEGSDGEKASAGNVPKTITVSQYPNPFNPSTKIEYSLPQTASVTLQVFDILGNEVANLVREIQQPGVYEVEFDARGLASGMYFYRIQVVPSSGSGQAFFQTKKMLLLK